MRRSFQVLIVVLSGFIVLGSMRRAQQDEKDVYVKIATNYGDMTFRLYNETPLHRDNFVKLISEAYYDSLMFHRIIQNFMIQGGDPNSRGGQTEGIGNGGPGYTIPAEFVPKLFHKKGALAAARTGGPSNPEKRSSGSQFYIVQGTVVSDEDLMKAEARKNATRDSTLQFQYTDRQREIYTSIGGTPHLDGEYTVFGEMLEGMATLDSIAAVPANDAGRTLEKVFMKIEIMQ